MPAHPVNLGCCSFSKKSMDFFPPWRSLNLWGNDAVSRLETSAKKWLPWSPRKRWSFGTWQWKFTISFSHRNVFVLMDQHIGVCCKVFSETNNGVLDTPCSSLSCQNNQDIRTTQKLDHLWGQEGWTCNFFGLLFLIWLKRTWRNHRGEASNPDPMLGATASGGAAVGHRRVGRRVDPWTGSSGRKSSAKDLLWCSYINGVSWFPG